MISRKLHIPLSLPNPSRNHGRPPEAALVGRRHDRWYMADCEQRPCCYVAKYGWSVSLSETANVSWSRDCGLWFSRRAGSILNQTWMEEGLDPSRLSGQSRCEELANNRKGVCVCIDDTHDKCRSNSQDWEAQIRPEKSTQCFPSFDSVACIHPLFIVPTSPGLVGTVQRN